MQDKLFRYSFLALAALLMAGLLSGCSRFSHNFNGMFFGTRVSIGSPEFGELSYLHGFGIIDASREESSYSVEIDKEDGLSFTDGKLKGVTRITRTIGKQITGYAVDLAKKDSKAVEEWLSGECKCRPEGKPAEKSAEKEREAVK